MASTEKSIENEIKTYLETRRLQGDQVFFYKQFQSGATMQGLPDIIASIQGCFVGIEVKTPSGVVSPHQRIVAKLIIQAGGIFILCDNSPQFIEWYANNYHNIPSLLGKAFSLKWIDTQKRGKICPK